jgi:hypothetical protein
MCDTDTSQESERASLYMCVTDISHESERASLYMCVTDTNHESEGASLYMCVTDIIFASFYDFSFGFLNCSHSVLFYF